MPPAVTKPPPTQRKRNRKRKRRAASTSSSSDSSSSSSSEDEAPKATTKIVPIVPSLSQPQLESDSSSDSDSSLDDTTAEIPRGRQANNVTPKTPRQFSPSPSPPSAALPCFLPSENAEDDVGSKEKELQNRFRQFWMSSVADGFKEDLESIRKVSRYFRLDKIAYYVTDMSQFFFFLKGT
jgi:ribosome assembly protein 3